MNVNTLGSSREKAETDIVTQFRRARRLSRTVAGLSLGVGVMLPTGAIPQALIPEAVAIVFGGSAVVEAERRFMRRNCDAAIRRYVATTLQSPFAPQQTTEVTGETIEYHQPDSVAYIPDHPTYVYGKSKILTYVTSVMLCGGAASSEAALNATDFKTQATLAAMSLVPLGYGVIGVHGQEAWLNRSMQGYEHQIANATPLQPLRPPLIL